MCSEKHIHSLVCYPPGPDPDPGWISGVANTASLPSLFLSYVADQFYPDYHHEQQSSPPSGGSEETIFFFEHYAILATITLLLAYVNYRGLDVVGRIVVVIFFVTMTPFFLMVVMGIPKGELI